MLCFCSSCILLLAQLPLVESKDFSKELQQTAITATVRISNKTQNSEGAGVIVRQQGAFVYILTACHIVEAADTVEVATFSVKSFPKPEKVYTQVAVVARAREPDLALLRLVSREPLPGSLRICPANMAPTDKEFTALSSGIDSGQPKLALETVNGKKRVRKPNGETSDTWELAKPPDRGRSGGPLLDKRGYLIGIGSGRADNKGYCAHLDEIYRFFKQNDLLRLLEEPKD